jgi:hypothetical protein
VTDAAEGTLNSDPTLRWTVISQTQGRWPGDTQAVGPWPAPLSFHTITCQGKMVPGTASILCRNKAILCRYGCRIILDPYGYRIICNHSQTLNRKESHAESDPNVPIGEAAARNAEPTSPSSWPDTTRSPSVEKEHVMTFSHRLSFMYHGGRRERCGMTGSDPSGYNLGRHRRQLAAALMVACRSCTCGHIGGTCANFEAWLDQRSGRVATRLTCGSSSKKTNRQTLQQRKPDGSAVCGSCYHFAFRSGRRRRRQRRKPNGPVGGRRREQVARGCE